MPNWVTNLLNITGPDEQIENLRKKMNTEDNDFDFNSIIKMPPELNVTSGSLTDWAIAYYKAKAFNDYTEVDNILTYPWCQREHISTHDELLKYFTQQYSESELMEKGRQYVFNQKKYGCTTWYDWCNRYWGTKWNACDATFDGYSGYFNTAWSNVVGLILRLSEDFPTLEFNYEYADEDFGCNCGRYKIRNGTVIDNFIPSDGSEEAMDLAADILGYDCRDEDDYDDE